MAEVLFDTPLELPIIPRAATTIGFDTTLLVDSGGNERRFPKVVEYRLSVDFGSLLFTADEAQQLRDYFNAREGRKQPFPFKFWADHKVSQAPETYGTEPYTVWQVGRVMTKSDGGSSGLWQLAKEYGISSQGSFPARRGFKTINYPIPGTVKIYDDLGGEYPGAVVNYATGEVTGLPPTAGSLYTWGGEFYLGVRFNTDVLPQATVVQVKEEDGSVAHEFSKDGVCTAYYQFDGLGIEEVLSYRHRSYSKADFESGGSVFVPYNCEGRTDFFDLTETQLFNTRIEGNDTGFEKRKAQHPRRTQVDIGNAVLTEAEMRYLLTWFIAKRGRFGSFTYNAPTYGEANYRFDSDNLSFQLLRYEEDMQTFLYEFPGISLVTHFSNDLFARWDSETEVRAYIDTSGSMDDAIPTIQAAIADLRNLVRDVIYGGSQAEVDQKFPPPINRDDERWLYWATLSLNAQGSQNINTIVMCFINESGGFRANLATSCDLLTTGYHLSNHPNNTQDEDLLRCQPSSQFLSDLNLFQAAHAEYTGFQGLIFGFEITNFPPDEIFAEQRTFVLHVNAALTGTEGYPVRLVDYGWSALLELDPNTTAGEFLELSGLSVFTSPERALLRESTLAHCVKITRFDGTILGFTSHDCPLYIEGVLYRANSAMNPFAVENKANLTVDQTSVRAFLDDDSINDVDLINGVYDRAEVELFIVDFTELPSNSLEAALLLSGYAGEISVTPDYYNLELRSKAALLNQKRSVKVSGTCRHEQYDGRCQLNRALFTFSATVIDVISSTRFQLQYQSGTPLQHNLLSRGRVEFKTGKLTGFITSIFTASSSGDPVIELFEQMPFSPEIGDVVEVSLSCC